MDNNLKDNDPYNNMETAEDEIEPGFLKSTNDSQGRKTSYKKRIKEGAATIAGLAGATGGVSGIIGGAADSDALTRNTGSIEGLRKSETSPDSFFTGKGKQIFQGKKSKFKMNKMSLAVIVIFVALIGATVGVVVGTPIFMIGNIDFNLQDALGFTNTTAILEKQAGYVLSEQMANGEVPDRLAGDFAEHGLMVGQVTANGDFVRTNVFIANAEELKDLAVLGNFQVKPSDGELAMLYNNEIIMADEFVAAVESNPEMYAEYSDALDISARFYYSDDVNNVYNEMGLSRGAFSEWVDTGDEEKNKESFDEILDKILNKSSNLIVGEASTGGENGEEGSESDSLFETDISGKSSASEVIDSVSKGSSGSKAAQLLNAAISASEPYLAASAFLAIEEPIQRTRIDGDGPVHEVMNMLNEENKVSYMDVESRTMKDDTNSILTTGNFVSAVSAGKYSLNEAINYSRDRAIKTTQINEPYNLISNTAVSTDGQKSSKIGLPFNLGGGMNGDLSMLEDSVDKALIQKNSDLMRSVVGGNRIVEGGSFLSNSINGSTIAAMPSDASTISAYHREVEEVMARKAEAERATKSPFDITSPYTFMGSLAHSIANVAIRNRVGSNEVGSSLVGAVADLTNDSAKSIWSSVVADGKDDSYATTFGGYCDTVRSINVEGDIYCTAHRTISTSYMNRNSEEWKSSLSGDVDDSGNVRDGSELSEFIKNGMGRKATVGVKSADVCQSSGGGFFSGVIRSILGACVDVNVDVANGSKYTFREGDSAVKQYGGYVLYDTVSSLMNDSVSKVSAYKKKYYEEHPIDNSRAGKIARISGLTKAEAEIALNYADYLVYIAKYNPANRYAFGTDLRVEKPHDVLFEYNNRIAVDLYVMWHGNVEYNDLRNRTQVA